MSEQLKHSHEHQQGESFEEEARANLERIKNTPEDSGEKLADKVEELEKTASQEALSKDETKLDSHDAYEVENVSPAQLKSEAFQSYMQKVRGSLKPAEQILSKAIHHPVVDKASEVAGKTIARPSGVLGGGIISCLGGLFTLFMAKKYGFEYNYLLFLLLFAGGFIVGMVIEIMIKIVTRKK